VLGPSVLAQWAAEALHMPDIQTISCQDMSQKSSLFGRCRSIWSPFDRAAWQMEKWGKVGLTTRLVFFFYS
jgi:hypothetical protein